MKYSLLFIMLLYNSTFCVNYAHSYNRTSLGSPIVEKLFNHIGNYSVYINSVENKIGFITLRKFTDLKNRIDYVIVLDTKTMKTFI